MPIYEYRCQSCSTRFEIFFRSAAEPAACPQCRGTALTRLFSRFAVVRGEAAGDDFDDVSDSSSAPDFGEDSGADACPPEGCGHCQDNLD